MNLGDKWPTPTAGDAVGARNRTSGRQSGSKHHDGITLNDAVWGTVALEGDPSDAVNRVHRLKALGNGIVPAVAYPFAVAIARELTRAETAP